MRRFSLPLFLGALVLLGFLAGSATDVGTRFLAAADTAIRGGWQSLASPVRLAAQGEFVDVPASDAAAGRIQLLASSLAGSVLIAGGRHRFVDHCPGFVGCLALEYDRHGRFVHAYPFRPETYEAALVPHGLAVPVGDERALWFDFAKHADVFAIDSYSNGDLAVVLRSRLSFPPQIGVARVDRAGLPRWYRADDGSHHWPTVAHGRLRGAGAGLGDALVVPSLRAGAGMPRGLVTIRREKRMGRGPCARHFVDYLHVIDGDGALLQAISVAETLRHTRHAPMLSYSQNTCQQVHLNSVEVLTAAGPGGLAAGDFLVSMRGLGALAVLDGGDGRLKRIWRGSFYGQHGARALPGPGGPTFLMFDNWGQDEPRRYRPGRLLALDAQSGRERTIFPNASSPAAVRMRTIGKGGVSLAPDGSRAIVFARSHAVEVDLASGQTTAVFQSLDDVSALDGAAGPLNQAHRWHLRGVHYVAPAGRATD